MKPRKMSVPRQKIARRAVLPTVGSRLIASLTDLRDALAADRFAKSSPCDR